jgi:hypothetical protein
VAVDFPERMTAAVVLTAAQLGGERLLVFAGRQQGWLLEASQPAIDIGAAWQEVFPKLAERPPVEAWGPAFRDWAQSAGLPLSEQVELASERPVATIQASASRSLVEHWRKIRPEVFREPIWLLAGEGLWRAAARLDLRAI